MNKRWPILAVFVLSGAAGLVYEVVWARQLVLVFGNTTEAVSAILTGFFGGMAIGSAFGGRLGDRVARPLRLYAILELLLVGVVLLTPLTFGLLREVYRGAFASLEGSPTLLGLLRFALSLLALGPATVLMGVTLPTLTRYLTRSPSGLSVAFGSLYSANTAGAILGTIAAGFFLIELFGLTGTLIVGAACSFVAGVLALVIDQKSRAPLSVDSPSDTADHRTSVPDSEASPRPQLRLAMMVSFASGLTSLSYQVLWTRLFSNGTGSSTYVFTTILVVFLFGLAAGAFVFSLVRKRIGDVMSFLSQGQLTIGVLAVIPTIVSLHTSSPSGLALTTRFENLFTGFIGPMTAVVLPATFFMGLTFPAISALVADRQGRIAANTGLLLSANTFGAIVGTFVVPFFLIPAVGSTKAIALVALANLGVAFALSEKVGIRAGRERLIVRIVAGGLSLAIVAALLIGGIFADQNELRVARLGGTIFESREDRIASVQAGDYQFKQLWVAGYSMTALTVDAKLMPILPLMLRPASRSILTVAFGMGSAHRAALRAGLRADVVELVPSVPPMFHWFYADADGVLADPKGRVIISDGRNYVELTDRKYDIIVTDPAPPIESAGVSVISSREYYLAARKCLTPGGVMMQWLPYDQTLDELKVQIRTYHDVFPHVIVAPGPGGNGFFMLGSESPIRLDPMNIRQVLARPGVVEDLSSAFDSPVSTLEGWEERVPKLVWLAGDQVSAFTGKGPLLTDDRPFPEYFLLRHLLGAKSPRISPELLIELTNRLTESR